MKKTVKSSANALFNIIFKFRRLVHQTELPFKLYDIRVESIRYVSDKTLNHDVFSKYWYHGVVADGDWDLKRDKIESDCLFIFSKKLFLEHRQIEETEYYKKIISGQLERYIKSEKHLIYRVDQYRDLYQKIKTHGYKPQQSMENGSVYDEVCISIDRHGDYILEDGRHRFFIAKLLGIEEIPVILNKVHRHHWEKINQDLSLLISA